MKKIFEVEFPSTYRVELIEEKQLDMYDSMKNIMRIQEVENCQKCGEKTKALEIVGSLARCKDCQENYRESQLRAGYYQSLSYDFEDNDF